MIDIIQHIFSEGDRIEVKTYKPFDEAIVHCGECRKYCKIGCPFADNDGFYPTELDYCSWGERE